MAAYDGLPDTVCGVGLGDSSQRLGFDPLSEVVDRNEGLFVLSRRFWKLVDDVHAPFCKGTWYDDAI